MKRTIFLAGMALPLLSHSQAADTSTHSKLVTTSPRLGGVNITNSILPIRSGENTYTMQLPTVDVGIPIYKDFSSPHPSFIRTGIRYEGLFLTNEPAIGGNNFHSVTVPLLVSYSVTRTTSIAVIGLASIASDFKRSIKAEDILYTGGIRLGFRPGKTLSYGVTLTYTSNYSGKFLLPIPDVDWTITNKWSLTGVIPVRASLKYKITAGQSLGATIGFNGTMYRLNAAKEAQYLHMRQSSGGLIYDLSLGGRWKANVIAGHTFMQRLETFDLVEKVPFGRIDKLNSRTPNVSYRQNTFIFQGGISYQF